MNKFKKTKVYNEYNHITFICPVCRKSFNGVVKAGFETEVPVKPIYYNDSKLSPLVECPFCEKSGGYFDTAPDMIACDTEIVDIINALLDKGYSYINESFNGGYMKTLIKNSAFFNNNKKDNYFEDLTTIQYPNVNIDMEESIRNLFHYYQKNYKDLNKEEVKTILKLLVEIYLELKEVPDKEDLINEVDNITDENCWMFASSIIEFIYDVFKEIFKLDYDTEYEECNGEPFITDNDFNNIVMSLYGYDEDDSNMELHITSNKITEIVVEGTEQYLMSYKEAREILLRFIKEKLPNLYSLTDMIELYNRVKLYKATHKKEE